jgi:hypothetical protein
MQESVFLDVQFFLLVIVSVIAPISAYIVMLRRRLASRGVILAFGSVLVIMAGINVYLLGWLSDAAKQTPSKVDDEVFASAVSLALFLFPAVFAGIGIHIISHVMIRHLDDAETLFEEN